MLDTGPFIFDWPGSRTLGSSYLSLHNFCLKWQISNTAQIDMKVWIFTLPIQDVPDKV